MDNDSPADFNNIQAAIDDANNGDTVLITDGTYASYYHLKSQDSMYRKALSS